MGASKDSDKYLLLGRELPAAGLALARFDFRGSGESGGRHEDATIETRVADLEGVLDHLAKRPELDGRFGLLGSSLGGFVALWVAAARAGGAPLPVVTWNAPASLRELPDADPTSAGRALVAEVRRGAAGRGARRRRPRARDPGRPRRGGAARARAPALRARRPSPAPCTSSPARTIA